MIQEHILQISEVFLSVQGEGVHAGRPMHFVRMTGCNIKCVYCDTPEKDSGYYYSIDEIIEKVSVPLQFPVNITGGEPMIQEEVHYLIINLLAMHREVHLETNGTLDLKTVAPRAMKSVDVKTPGSGASAGFLLSNLSCIYKTDEIKFVVTTREDFDWSIAKCREWQLPRLTPNIIIQPAWGMVDPKDLAEWVKSTELPVRLGLQIHKYIWGPNTRGV